MPYPNIKAPEIQAKMRYYSLLAGKSGHEQKNGFFEEKMTGDVYYENLCMKAVN